MGLKISNNLLKKMVKEPEIKLKLSKDLITKEEQFDMSKVGFKRAGDLTTEEIVKPSKMALEEVKQYVLAHTAKTKSHYDLVAEAGSIIVSFEEFIKMINDGYEIYKSEVLNENLISIVFQKEMKRNKSK